jgi:hypothetical protein
MTRWNVDGGTKSTTRRDEGEQKQLLEAKLRRDVSMVCHYEGSLTQTTRGGWENDRKDIPLINELAVVRGKVWPCSQEIEGEDQGNTGSDGSDDNVEEATDDDNEGWVCVAWGSWPRCFLQLEANRRTCSSTPRKDTVSRLTSRASARTRQLRLQITLAIALILEEATTDDNIRYRGDKLS